MNPWSKQYRQFCPALRGRKLSHFLMTSIVQDGHKESPLRSTLQTGTKSAAVRMKRANQPPARLVRYPTAFTSFPQKSPHVYYEGDSNIEARDSEQQPRPQRPFRTTEVIEAQ